ncbi:MAG: glutamate--tRNA ligase [Firmicutes bacterium]|nr:glutamate--tRNA ligase [Bacillota bacterium]
MTNKDLANLIFPNIDKDIAYYENLYKPRDLKEGEKVTRFAPSPTGYMHLGGFYQAIIDFMLVKNSGGTFYLRNEDTDQQREVEGATKLIMDTLNHYGIVPNEYEYNGETVGNYGPYIQSERKEIYHAFIKHLIEIGRAYPCFCTKEELEELRGRQEARKFRTGYYGKWAKCRILPIEEQIKRIEEGCEYVIRFRSNGNFDRKFRFEDLVKGKLDLPENDEDFVIMKSNDKLPTYHFAHIVDDHLMHTTHVVRGEEWLSSLPKHLELFRAFEFKAPKYVHTPLLVKKEGNGVRKISKRKDPEASMTYYKEKGYPTLAVIESLMTIINSNYEMWHDQNPDKNFTDFEYSPKKMSASGAFYDLEKLDNISRNVISKMKATEVYDELLEWTKEYDEEFYKLLADNKEYSINLFNIEREQKKPRKDFVNYSTIKDNVWYMYKELFDKKEKEYDFKNITDKEEIKNICNTYIEKYYDINDDKDTWFNKVKELCDELGYASDMKAYKENPDNFKGNVADVSTAIRVAVTTSSMTPDLYEILKLLGVEEIKRRIELI